METKKNHHNYWKDDHILYLITSNALISSWLNASLSDVQITGANLMCLLGFYSCNQGVKLKPIKTFSGLRNLAIVCPHGS